MSFQRPAQESHVPDDIQDFVPDQFIVAPQHGQARCIIINNRIFQSTAFSKSQLFQHIQFSGKGNSTGKSYIADIVFLGNFCIAELYSQHRMRIDRSKGNAESVIGKNGNEFIFFLHEMLPAHSQNMPRCIQIPYTGLFNQSDKGQAASVRYRRFNRIHFYNTIIDSHALQCRKQMFYRKYFGFSPFQCRRPHGIGHIG